MAARVYRKPPSFNHDSVVCLVFLSLRKVVQGDASDRTPVLAHYDRELAIVWRHLAKHNGLSDGVGDELAGRERGIATEPSGGAGGGI
jgi:hypothetical protein